MTNMVVGAGKCKPAQKETAAPPYAKPWVNSWVVSKKAENSRNINHVRRTPLPPELIENAKQFDFCEFCAQSSAQPFFDTDTIGLIVTLLVLSIFFIAAWRQRREAGRAMSDQKITFGEMRETGAGDRHEVLHCGAVIALTVLTRQR